MAANRGILHRQDTPAEVVVVPEAAIQGPVDEEPQLSACVDFKGSVGFIERQGNLF